VNHVGNVRVSSASVLFCAFLALCSCADSRGRSASPPSTARNLVLITIDTLRADRVGVYGHSGARTPAIDGLAARGVRFDRAFATAPITLTSHAGAPLPRFAPVARSLRSLASASEQ
jgi:hypothetical protein